MNQADFLRQLADVLDHDGTISPDQNLDELEEWDSLGVLSVIALLADLGLKIKPDRLLQIKTVGELLGLVGVAPYE